MSYFVINISDSDVFISKYTKQELQYALDNNYFGDKPTFLDEMPEEFNTDSWPNNSYTVIKGSVSSPKPKEVVTKWEPT